MQWDICDTKNLTTYLIGNTTYFYKPCVDSRNVSSVNVHACYQCRGLSNRTVQCAQFCEEFRTILPYVYLVVSCLSALCSLGVFGTYLVLPRLRKTGYSSKVFLYR